MPGVLFQMQAEKLQVEEVLRSVLIPLHKVSKEAVPEVSEIEVERQLSKVTPLEHFCGLGYYP